MSKESGSITKNSDLINDSQVIRTTEEAVKLVSFTQAQKLRVLPLRIHQFKGRQILVFATDASRSVAQAQIDLRFLCGLETRGIIVSEEEFQAGINKAYLSSGVVLKDVVETIAPLPSNNVTIVSSTPALRVLDAILTFAVTKDASDIHLVPSREGVQIDLRINGDIFRSRELISNQKIYSELLNRLKILSGLDTARPTPISEGRFSSTVNGNEIHARLSVIATAFGERITIRLMKAEAIGLLELGLQQKVLRLLDNIVTSPSGGVLISGPTGSGKSTLMYGLVKQLADLGLSISTIEDPIEVRIPGISQTEVNQRGGLTYESGFSALLRHDPDVLMLGEIRSAEVAKLAIQASLSGHLVLSTLHAGGIPEMILRLNSLGVFGTDLAAGIKLLINIALLPTLCQCRVLDLESSNKIGTKLFKSSGCHDCDFSGYSGRVPVLDLLAVDEEIAAAIARSSMDELKASCNQGNSLYKTEQVEQFLLAGLVSLRDCRGLFTGRF